MARAPTLNVGAETPTFKSGPGLGPGQHDIGVSEHEVALSGFYPVDMSHIIMQGFYPFDMTFRRKS